ncbi:MAG TPA: GNAT family N-acetyltransferase [Gaiellaceae bacterium]
MTIRPVTPDDVPGVVALLNQVELTSFASDDTFRETLEKRAAEATRLVAQVDGEIAGFARSGRGWLWIGVLPAHRGRGIGAALYDAIDPELPVRVQVDDEDGRRFVRSRGFELVHSMRLQALDLARTPLDGGAGSVSLRELDPNALRDLYLESVADIPTATPRTYTDDDFRLQVAESPILDRDASCAILEDGEPVAFSIVISNRTTGRAGAQMTGVRRDHRGRGLALAVKAASLRRARDAGLQTMLAANDLENAPMLAVNRKLGFEPSVLVEHYEKSR